MIPTHKNKNIPTYKYVKNILVFLNELKNSIPLQERLEIKNIEPKAIEAFIKKNRKEICNFIASTPNQRFSKKKWQKDFNLLTYSAFIMLYNSFNQIIDIQCKFNLKQQNSYRKDIATLAELIYQYPENEPNIQFLFFEDADYRIPQNHFFQNICY